MEISAQILLIISLVLNAVLLIILFDRKESQKYTIRGFASRLARLDGTGKGLSCSEISKVLKQINELTNNNFYRLIKDGTT